MNPLAAAGIVITSGLAGFFGRRAYINKKARNTFAVEHLREELAKVAPKE